MTNTQSPAPGVAAEVIKKLRDASNWLKQGFGNYKDVTSTYDRTPFEAADLLESIYAEAKPRGWLWSDGRDTGVLMVAQDYEAMKAKYPRMEFEPFYSAPRIAIAAADPVGVVCVSRYLDSPGMENIEYQPMRILPPGDHLLFLGAENPKSQAISTTCENEPVYLIRPGGPRDKHDSSWSEATKEAYDLTPEKWRRLLYTAPPLPAQVQAAESRDDVLLSVIQRLNGNPYSLTKSECISEVQALRDSARTPAPGMAGGVGAEERLAEAMKNPGVVALGEVLTGIAPHPSPAPQAEGAEPLWHCWAYGESDYPAVTLAKTRDEVIEFLCREWFGIKVEDVGDDETAVSVIAEFDAPDWDMGDSLEYKFEIGGVTITRLCAAAIEAGRAGS